MKERIIKNPTYNADVWLEHWVEIGLLKIKEDHITDEKSYFLEPHAMQHHKTLIEISYAEHEIKIAKVVAVCQGLPSIVIGVSSLFFVPRTADYGWLVVLVLAAVMFAASMFMLTTIPGVRKRIAALNRKLEALKAWANIQQK